MANHRMFSNRIANSAKFLQMPIESQLLYFHFILRADDDGVVESYPIIKLLNISPDSFKVLVAKQFIRIINEDQVVVIPDWLEHNTIRADRKVNSIYKHLIPSDIPLIEPKPRKDVKDNSNRLGGQSTDSRSKVKLRQVKLIKDNNISNSVSYLSNIPTEDMKSFLSRFIVSEKEVKSKAEDLALYCQRKNKRYSNYKAFLLNALKRDFKERDDQSITRNKYQAYENSPKV